MATMSNNSSLQGVSADVDWFTASTEDYVQILPRFFHNSCVHRDELTHQLHLYVFGGRDSTDHGHFNDVYCISVCLLTRQVVSVELLIGNGTNRQAPAPRRSASMVYHPQRHSLFVYGGRNEHTLFGCRSELYEFDIKNRGWQCHSFELTTGPGPLRNHTALLINDNTEMIIFGGYNVLYGVNPTSTMFKFNFNSMTWTDVHFEMADKQEKLLTLGQHTAVIWRSPSVMKAYEERMIVYGGNRTVRANAGNDVWEFRFDENLWYKIEPVQSSELPLGRYAHAACIHGDELFVLAGFQGNTDLNDFWSLNLSTRKWTKRHYQYDDFVFGHSLNSWESLSPILDDDNYFVYKDISRYNRGEADMTSFGGSDENSICLNHVLQFRVKLSDETMLNYLNKQIQGKLFYEHHVMLYADDMKRVFLDPSGRYPGDILVNTFNCHSFLLRQYPFFQELLDRGCKYISIPNIESEVLKHILLYIYSGRLDVVARNNYQMLINIAHIAANHFGMTDLAHICLTHFEFMLSCENVVAATKHIQLIMDANPNCTIPTAKLMYNKVILFVDRYGLKNVDLNSNSIDDYVLAVQPSDRDRHLLTVLESAPNRKTQLSSEHDNSQFITLLVRSSSDQKKVCMIADAPILIQRCEYFRCLFNHDFEETRLGEINFYDIPEGIIEEIVMKYLLIWIYCGNIDMIVSLIEKDYSQDERTDFISTLIRSANLLLLSDLESLLHQYVDCHLHIR